MLEIFSGIQVREVPVTGNFTNGWCPVDLQPNLNLSNIIALYYLPVYYLHPYLSTNIFLVARALCTPYFFPLP